MSKKKKSTKKKDWQLRDRYFGITKVKAGGKHNWVSWENKHGWSLGYVVKGRIEWMRNIRFATKAEAQKALGGKVVFTALKHPTK